jgi:eukaryotic-like serine/threonine-protein kinase
MNDLIGKTILHYKIIEKVGQGGMGVVYKAQDTKLKREVAIKFLPHYISGNEEERKRFEIEAQAAASLNHPNITTIYAIEESDEDVFIVMEFIDGIELKEKIKSGPIPTREAIKIALQIAEGLEAAHNKGIVHRDIKSSNIMITKDGKIKVMDFGLAKIGKGTQVTKIGSTVGTAAYMSPEQAKGEELDYRTDIWSFGVVLYEMLTGQLPFNGDYEQAIMFAVLNEQPKAIQIVAPDISSVLIHILDRTLEKDVTLRYQSISEVLIELHRMQLSGSRVSSLSGTSNQRIKIQEAIKTKGNKKIILLSILTFLIVAAAITLFIFNPFNSGEPVEPMKIVPLNGLPGVQMNPAISPNGEEVAFAWNGGKGENFNIYVQIIGTYEPQKLTSDSAFDAMPVWTPDGRSILFFRWKRSSAYSVTGTGYLVLIPARGGTEKLLLVAKNMAPPSYDQATHGYYPTVLAFSKSSKEYFGWSWDNGFHIALYDGTTLNTQPIEIITHPPDNYLGDFCARLSPDGSMLAFIRLKSDFDDFELHVMPYPYGAPKKLAAISGFIGGLSWTPDGKEIIVGADNKFTRVSSNDGVQKPVDVTSGLFVADPSISLVGNQLAFTRRSIRWHDLFRLDIHNPKKKDLVPVKVVSSSLEDNYGKISPDEKRIVFVSKRTGANQIWVSDINGANAIPIVAVSETHPPHPSWSPDGSFIMYEDMNVGIDVVSSSGGTPVKISKRITYMPRYSANGEWIYFCSNTNNDNQIWKVFKDGSKEVQVTKNGGEAAFESPDGKWVYYSRFWPVDKGICRIPVDGGEEQKIIDKAVYRDSWVLKENGIYYFIETPTKYDLFFYEFKNGKTIKINDFDKKTTSAYFDISPKEDWMLFAQSEETESNIMLIENFK